MTSSFDVPAPVALAGALAEVARPGPEAPEPELAMSLVDPPMFVGVPTEGPVAEAATVVAESTPETAALETDFAAATGAMEPLLGTGRELAPPEYEPTEDGEAWAPFVRSISSVICSSLPGLPELTEARPRFRLLVLVLLSLAGAASATLEIDPNSELADRRTPLESEVLAIMALSIPASVFCGGLSMTSESFSAGGIVIGFAFWN